MSRYPSTYNRCYTFNTIHERKLGFVLDTVPESIVEGLQEHFNALVKLLEGLL